MPCRILSTLSSWALESATMITNRKLGGIAVAVLALALAPCTSSMVAKSIIPTVSSTTASGTEAPSTTATGSEPLLDFSLSVDFASAEDGAVAFARGVQPGSGLCTLNAAVTTDGGRSFRPSILLGRDTACGSEAPSLALARGGTGWAAAAGQLWVISDDWRTWRVDSALATVVGANTDKLLPCDVGTAGATVWVSLCQAGQAGPTPVLLLRSTDQGDSWTPTPIA